MSAIDFASEAVEIGRQIITEAVRMRLSRTAEEVAVIGDSRFQSAHDTHFPENPIWPFAMSALILHDEFRLATLRRYRSRSVKEI